MVNSNLVNSPSKLFDTEIQEHSQNVTVTPTKVATSTCNPNTLATEMLETRHLHAASKRVHSMLSPLGKNMPTPKRLRSGLEQGRNISSNDQLVVTSNTAS